MDEVRIIFTGDISGLNQAADAAQRKAESVGRAGTTIKLGGDLTVQLRNVTNGFDAAERKALSLQSTASRLANIQRGPGFDYLSVSATKALKDASNLQTGLQQIRELAARPDNSPGFIGSLNRRTAELKSQLAGVERDLNKIRQIDIGHGFNKPVTPTPVGSYLSGPPIFGGPPREGGPSSSVFNNNPFLSGLTGGLVGAGAASAALVAVQSVKELATEIGHLGVESVRLAGNFELTVNAMTVFTGSTSSARAELAHLDELARNTPGLRMVEAEQGAARLRALGFEAATVNNLVVGLAKQKLISGVDDEGAIQRVIINLQQLKAGSPQIQRDIQQMVLSLPSLSIEITKAFGGIQQFKKAIEEDSDAALTKFAKQLAESKAPVGGLNNAIDKLKDSLIDAGRTFGEPLLQPLTKDAKDLTDVINRNKDTWRDWGQYTSDIIRGASKEWEEYLEFRKNAQDNPVDRYVNSLGSDEDTFANNFYSILRNGPVRGGLQAYGRHLASEGRQEREKLEEAERQRSIASEPELLKQYGLPQDFIGPISEDMLAASRKSTTTQKRVDAEKAAQDIKEQYEVRKSLTENFYKVEEAKLRSHLDTTKAEELQTLRQVAEIKRRSLEAQRQNAEQNYYLLTKTVDLAPEDRTKADYQHQKEIDRIKSDSDVQQLETQRAIAAKEKEIADQRKQSVREIRALVASTFETTTGNGIVKFFVDGQNAIDATFDKFKDIDLKFAQTAANAQAAAERYKINLAFFDSEEKALKYRQEARALAALPDNQINGFQRRLSGLEQAGGFINSAANLRRAAFGDAAYANGYNPARDPFGGVREIITQLGQFEQTARRINSVSLKFGELGVEGSSTIASAKLNALPSRQELLELIKTGDPFLQGRARDALADRSFLENQVAAGEDKKLENLLAQQKANDLERRSAYEQLDLLRSQGGGLNDAAQLDKFLDITKDLGNAELTPELRQARVEALLKRSEVEDAQRKESLGVAKSILSEVKQINGKVGSNAHDGKQPNPVNGILSGISLRRYGVTEDGYSQPFSSTRVLGGNRENPGRLEPGANPDQTFFGPAEYREWLQTMQDANRKTEKQAAGNGELTKAVKDLANRMDNIGITIRNEDPEHAETSRTPGNKDVDRKY
jgi:hypothetical protein